MRSKQGKQHAWAWCRVHRQPVTAPTAPTAKAEAHTPMPQGMCTPQLLQPAVHPQTPGLNPTPDPLPGATAAQLQLPLPLVPQPVSLLPPVPLDMAFIGQASFLGIDLPTFVQVLLADESSFTAALASSEGHTPYVTHSWMPVCADGTSSGGCLDGSSSCSSSDTNSCQTRICSSSRSSSTSSAPSRRSTHSSDNGGGGTSSSRGSALRTMHFRHAGTGFWGRVRCQSLLRQQAMAFEGGQLLVECEMSMPGLAWLGTACHVALRWDIVEEGHPAKTAASAGHPPTAEAGAPYAATGPPAPAAVTWRVYAAVRWRHQHHLLRSWLQRGMTSYMPGVFARMMALAEAWLEQQPPPPPPRPPPPLQQEVPRQHQPQGQLPAQQQGGGQALEEGIIRELQLLPPLRSMLPAGEGGAACLYIPFATKRPSSLLSVATHSWAAAVAAVAGQQLCSLLGAVTSISRRAMLACTGSASVLASPCEVLMLVVLLLMLLLQLLVGYPLLHLLHQLVQAMQADLLLRQQASIQPVCALEGAAT